MGGPHPGITGYMGGGSWTLLCIQWLPPRQYAVRGTACRAPSSAGHPRTSKEAAWGRCRIPREPHGPPRNSGKFSRHHW